MIYALAARRRSPSAGWPNPGPIVHLFFFLASGLLWVLPAMWIIRWMIRELKTAIEHFRFLPDHGTALSPCYYRNSERKTAYTFPGIALDRHQQLAGVRQQRRDARKHRADMGDALVTAVDRDARQGEQVFRMPMQHTVPCRDRRDEAGRLRKSTSRSQTAAR